MRDDQVWDWDLAQIKSFLEDDELENFEEPVPLGFVARRVITKELPAMRAALHRNELDTVIRVDVEPAASNPDLCSVYFSLKSVRPRSLQ